MAQTSVNNEKKARVIREVKQEDLLKTFENIKSLINSEDFVSEMCNLTSNGLYKLTTSRPENMSGVKEHEHVGIKWYKVPTTDYRVAIDAYISYRLTAQQKAKAEMFKKFKELTLEQQMELLAKAAEQAL